MTDPAPAGPPPIRSRLGGVVRFVFAHQLQTVVTIAVGFVATPFLLAWLGQERFGLVRVLEAWAALLGVGLWCLGMAIGAGLVSRLAAGDWTGISRLMSAAGGVAAGIGAAVFAGGFAVVFLFPDLTPAPGALKAEWETAFLITIGGALLGPLTVARTLFEADQRGYRVSLTLTATSLLTTGLGLTAAWLGWGLIGQSVATVVGGAATAVALTAWALRAYPGLRPVRPPRAEVLAVLRHTSRLLFAGLCGTLAARAEVLAANREAGPDGVTRYVLTQRLFALWQGQLLAIGTALWAPLGDLFARGERAAFADHLRTAITGIVGVGFAGAVAFVGYTPHFLRLWRVGADQFVGPVAAGVFGLIVPLAAVHSLQGWVITSTGHFRQALAVAVVYAVASAAGCFGLGAVWGLTGVAVGMLFAYAVSIVCFTRVLARDLGVPVGACLFPLARGLVLAVPVGALAWWAGASHVPFGWAGLLAEMGGWFVLYLAAWYATSGEIDRRAWTEVVRRVVRR